MSNDRYGELVQSGLGKKIAKNLGLPTPVALARFEVGQPVLTGEVALGAGVDKTGQIQDDSVLKALIDDLNALNGHISLSLQIMDSDFATYLDKQDKQKNAGVFAHLTDKLKNESQRFKVVIFDASNLKSSDDLKQLYDFFHPLAKKIKTSGRVIVIGRPECCVGDDIDFALAQRALEGFVKSVAKEFKKGISANLVYVKKGLERQMTTTLQFLMSSKSAYVSGQVVRLTNDVAGELALMDNHKPLLGKKILVTGASRGIGAAISEVLARDGAQVVCLDVAMQLADLQRQAAKIGGQALPLDITDDHAAEKITKAVGKLDGVVHNAGITRDKTLANMTEDKWQMVLDINLGAISRMNRYWLDNDGLTQQAHIVCVSSISGIAGNLGQTNYATSKAGVIGLTVATAKMLAGTGRTINAVAPGFIETKMTAAIPFAIREAGRRMNSMSQGGEPVDVAETIAYLLAPNTQAVNGNVIRVCGQSVLGA